MPGRLAPAAVRKQIRSGALEPIYLVRGDNTTEKTALIADFAEAIEADLRAFNVERFYGSDSRSESVLDAALDAARTLPFAAPRRIVMLLQVDKLRELKRESQATEQSLAALEDYLKSPVAETTLVLVEEDKLDGRTRVATLLVSHAAVVECGGLVDVPDTERWVKAAIAAAGRQIEPAAARLIAERVGPDVTRVRAEVDRVLLFAAEKPRIEVGDVEEVIGHAVSHDAWAMTNAIERGQVKIALKQLALSLEGGAVPYMVLGQLAWFVRTKLPKSRVKDAVEAVFRTDLDLKSSAGDPRVLLERLVVELCGEAS